MTVLFAAAHESVVGTKQTWLRRPLHVRYQVKSGPDLLNVSSSAFDPQPTSSIVTTRIARVAESSICETSTVALNAAAARERIIAVRATITAGRDN
jgi:hypothetical protein